MGVFVEFTNKEIYSAKIEKDKAEELKNNILEVMREGGMFYWARTDVYGKNVYLLRNPEFDDDGEISASLSYINGRMYPDFGYESKKTRIYSDKVGGYFADLVGALYTLYSFYTEEQTDVVIAYFMGEEKKNNAKTIGWLKYVLGDRLSKINKDISKYDLITTDKFLGVQKSNFLYRYEPESNLGYNIENLLNALSIYFNDAKIINDDCNYIKMLAGLLQKIVSKCSKLCKNLYFEPVYILMFEDTFYEIISNINDINFKKSIICLSNLIDKFGDDWDSFYTFVKGYMALLSNKKLRKKFLNF